MATAGTEAQEGGRRVAVTGESLARGDAARLAGAGAVGLEGKGQLRKSTERGGRV